MKRKVVRFCMTCVAQHQGRAMSSSEATLHKDFNPDHNIADCEVEPEPEVVQEEKTAQGGPLR